MCFDVDNVHIFQKKYRISHTFVHVKIGRSGTSSNVFIIEYFSYSFVASKHYMESAWYIFEVPKIFNFAYFFDIPDLPIWIRQTAPNV